MARIDAHQHFWKYNPVRDAWITDDMAVIQKDFMPEDLQPLLQENGLDGCVIVQSDQSEAENDFQLANADKHDFIKGVVGWVELVSPKIEERLEYYSQFKKLKGFRHVLQGMPKRDFMLTPAFLNGISLLSKYNFTYDILIFPDQLKFAAELAAKFPDQKFVVDHIAKPYIKDRVIAGWEEDMTELGKLENVYCKLSGMVTEANWREWRDVDFHPYMNVVMYAFGTDRLMFGSDWPVCTVAGSYAQICDIVKGYFSDFSKAEQDKIWGENAIEFYSL